MSEVRKGVVVHGIRGYLSRTETFVGDQVTTLKTHTPVVVCHHKSENRAYDVNAMYVINEQHNGFSRAIGEAAYTALRTLTPSEIDGAAAWLAKYRPLLMHFHFAVDAAFFAPLYKKMRIPAIVSFYGYDVSAFPNKFGGLGRHYLQRAFKSMDLFLVMSEDMKRDAVSLGVPAEKIVVHYYGINTTRFRFDGRSYDPKTRFNILCVGTLEPKKGQHHLLRALAELRKRRPDIDAHVTLVGSGPLLKECEGIVQSNGLQDRVKFAGHVPHFDSRLVEHYRCSDAFVHFSTRQPAGDKEGIPGTIVEAMASGLPVIATMHAGIPEAIVNGQHGILLEEKDTNGIASWLIRLHGDQQLRERLGREAAVRALSQLDVGTKTRELEEIYESVVRKQKTFRDTTNVPGGGWLTAGSAL